MCGRCWGAAPNGDITILIRKKQAEYMQQENTQRFTIIDDDRISNMICEKVLKDTFPGVQVY